MAIETLTIETREDAGCRILKLDGPLVLRTLFEFQDAIRAPNPNHLILDLSGVEYMDSAGLGAILEAHVSYQRRGKHVVLIAVAPRIETLFEVTHTDQILVRRATLEEAKRV
jgi:anti-sigma B factor antagonist